MHTINDAWVDFAHTLADEAAEVIRPFFRSDLAVELKDDASPVTLADRQAEHVMRSLIMETWPEHGIIGEEFGNHNETADWKWVLDPIDGTRSFIAGEPLFGTLISLVYKDTPVIGLINQPITGERWVGVIARQTTYNGEYCETSGRESLAEAVLSTTSPKLFTPEGFLAFERVRERSRSTIYGYDCYAYAMLSKGSIDLVIESGLKPHDFCALAPVVRGAGGRFTDWQGGPITLHSKGDVIAAASTDLLEETIGVLSP